MAGVPSLDELVGLLDRFGMKVAVDLDDAASDGVSPELVTGAWRTPWSAWSRPTQPGPRTLPAPPAPGTSPRSR